MHPAVQPQRTAALLVLLVSPARAVVSVSPAARTRAAVRGDLLRHLDGREPTAAAPGALHELVEELETHAALPATSDFLLLGLHGSWTERLQSDRSTADAAPALSHAQQQLVTVREVTQHFGDGVLRSVADFEVPSDGLSGSLEVAATVYPTTRSDMLHLLIQGHTLSLDGKPGVPLPALMEALMGRLSPEFRAEEGVRLGMQLSYIDEGLRVSRCTTRQLAGYCTVHSRRNPLSTD